MKWMSLCGLGMLGFGLVNCMMHDDQTRASTASTDSNGTVEHESYPTAKANEIPNETVEKGTAKATPPIDSVQPTPAAGADNQPRPVVPSAADTSARIDRIDARIADYTPMADKVELRSRARAYALLKKVKEERGAIEIARAVSGRSPDAKAQADEQQALAKLESDLDQLETAVRK